MRHLTLTLAEDLQAAHGSTAQDAKQVKNPMVTEKEPSIGKAATTAAALPKEVLVLEAQGKVEAGTGSPSHLPETILVRGEIEGHSDLAVEGRVDGPINLGTNNLTIGRTGQVNGNIQARNVTILGGVVGNVVATEKVEITDSGRLVGAICAPRIAVLDGAHFKGSVDMAGLGQANVRRKELASLPPAQQEHTELEVPAASK
jgi:cytoskeletal protein CcmA (bactofilin family)